jgi:hypothetical protein
MLHLSLKKYGINIKNPLAGRINQPQNAHSIEVITRRLSDYKPKPSVSMERKDPTKPQKRRNTVVFKTNEKFHSKSSPKLNYKEITEDSKQFIEMAPRKDPKRK